MTFLALALAALSQPNIVLITIDTLRADHVGAYGASPGATPALDALASEGLRFENAISPVPLTRPAHASLFTGLYPQEHGIRDNLPSKLDSSTPTLATRLEAAGYETAAFVGSFLLGRGSGFERGFGVFGDGSASGTGDRIGAKAERRAEDVAAEALDYLANARPPFFLWVHFYDPHAPYDPPGEFAGKGYAGEIAYADSHVGRLVTALRARGLLDSTLLVATADHGEGLGDHGEDEHGVLVYEETLRVPLIAHGPGIAAGRVEREPMSLVDVATFLLEGKVATPRKKTLYFVSYYGFLHFGWSPLRGVREGSMKLIFAPRPELYDLASDPRETNDLSRERKDVARRLFAELQKFGEGSREAASVSAGDLERLASLGYVGTPSKKGTGADPKDEIANFSDFGRKLREAITLFERGDFRSARPLLEELASRDILSFEVHLYLARCHRLEKNLAEAIREYQAAAAIYDEYSVLHHELGRALLASGDPAAAAAAFEKSLSIAPSAEAEVGLATAARKLGDAPRAIAALRRALALDPDDADSWNELGGLLLQRDEVDPAIAAFERALALRPEDEMFRHNLEFARGIRAPRERSEPGREEATRRRRESRESGRPPRAKSEGSEPSEERGEQ
jgi:arylsulfatase A-like enzyme/Tfp pilus assembly protein PilF